MTLPSPQPDSSNMSPSPVESGPCVDLQIAVDGVDLPTADDFRRWVAAALPADQLNSELTIRVVDEAESQMLNGQYRQQPKPTNVLSFEADLPIELDVPLLGDLVICAAVIEREAREQNKTLQAHWAHIVIHGTLHLQGYDHILDDEAAEMEALETRIMSGLQFPAPYE